MRNYVRGIKGSSTAVILSESDMSCPLFHVCTGKNGKKILNHSHNIKHIIVPAPIYTKYSKPSLLSGPCQIETNGQNTSIIGPWPLIRVTIMPMRVTT